MMDGTLNIALRSIWRKQGVYWCYTNSYKFLGR